MATLILPYPAFTAGTPAVAAEVQDNFTTIRDHINSQNIGTANIETTLVSRVGGPILFLNQASQEQIALSILNSRTKSALQITQSAVLGAGSSIIAINDNATQTTGDAQLYINTQTGSTIPSIKVNHGSDVTMSLTKTQLDLFNGAVQATSAGVVSVTTVTATDVNTTNVTATGLLDLTAPASDAIVAEIKGRSSDNNAIVQFKSNNDATVYASATSSPSGLTLNLPDTADSYTFKVNDVTKAVIDDNGVDGQYLKANSVNISGIVNHSITESKISQFPYIIFSGTYGPLFIVSGTYTTLGSSTFSITTARNLLMKITAPSQTNSTAAPSTINNWRILITGPSGTYYSGWTQNGVVLSQGGGVRNITLDQFVRLPDAGTYTVALQGSAYGDFLSYQNSNMLFQIMP